jgi:hypothetical protein
MGDTVSFIPDGSGTIEYSRPISEIKKRQGIFSFSYYYPYEYEPSFLRIKELYIAGLYVYLKICEKLDWNMVIYTNKFTINILNEIMKEAETYKSEKNIKNINNIKLFNHNKAIIILKWKEIMTSSFVSFGIVKWDEYTIGEAVDDSIMRIFRFRAFTDFPEKIVFVRDADTLFPEDLDIEEELIDLLKDWEIALLQKQQESGKQFLIGTQLEYNRKWHKNRYTQMRSFGVYAGLVNSLGNIPHMDSIWNQAIEYIRKGVKMKKYNLENGSSFYQLENRSTFYYVGKDEQILIFVYLRNLIENTYFFLFDYLHFMDYDLLLTQSIINIFSQSQNLHQNFYIHMKSIFDTMSKIETYQKTNRKNNVLLQNILKNPFLITPYTESENEELNIQNVRKAIQTPNYYKQEYVKGGTRRIRKKKRKTRKNKS